MTTDRVTALLDAYDAETTSLPLGHEMPTRGASTYNWRRSIVDELRALNAASPTSPASGAVAWMTADGRIATDETKRTAMASPSRAAFNIPLFPHPPAPSASMGRVTVKALEWSSEPPYSVARVPRLWLFYSTEAVWDDRKFCYAELSGGLASGRFETVAAAKAAAQADYEARILAALDSPPDHGGGEGSQP